MKAEVAIKEVVHKAHLRAVETKDLNLIVMWLEIKIKRKKKNNKKSIKLISILITQF